MKTTDELLRAYLESGPTELMGTIFREMQANEKRRAAWEEAHELKDDNRHATLVAALGGHDARLKRVETVKASLVPPSLEQFRSAEGSGSFHIPEHEMAAALAQVDARNALAQKQAVVRAAGKVALALITAALIFAGGSFWRDVSSPRGNTTITTVASPAAGK